MAKWLKDYLNFGSRRDAPQLPRPDYTESEILRAYRAQKDLDFEDPYQSVEKPQNGCYGGCRGTVSLHAFPAFASVLPNDAEVKVVSPKHRLIKVDSQEFSRSKIPLSPVTIHQEPVLPSAPTVVGDSDTVYSDPFDARPVPRLRADWEPNPNPHLSLGLSPITSPTLVAFSPNPILGLSLRPGDSSSYMEPFEAQRVITELQQGPERGRPGVGSGRVVVGIGDQLYDDPYDERTRHRHREAPPQQGREFLRDEPREVRESRLPQDDERPAEEYDQPWEWKKDNISKALAVKFEGAEWEKSFGQSDQAKLPRTSPTAPGGTANLRRPGDTPPILGERVDPCLPLERQVWYHGAVSRAEAEALLTLCKESSYLVRKSQTCPQDYSLSLRRSVYWLDELPPERNGSTTTFELTPHWSQLCGRKRLNSGFEQSRSSPQWEVSVAALSAYPSNRVCSLALPRFPTAGWVSDCPLLASLSRAVQTAVASPRVCQLACPEQRQGLYSPHSSKTSLAPPHPAATSSRLQLLAIPMSDHPQYAQDRPVIWPVPGPVRKAVASERVQALSQPNQRKALFQGYNPYTVTLAARSASASPRLQELCLPLPRKCKGK